jgi:hypothetical protein
MGGWKVEPAYRAFVDAARLREPDRRRACQTMLADSIFGLDENTEYELPKIRCAPKG